MQEHQDHARAWPMVQKILQAELGDGEYDTWLGSLQVDSVTNSSGPRGDQYTAHMSVATRFLRNWVADHYHDALLASWNKAEVPVAVVTIDVRTPAVRQKVVPVPVPAEVPEYKAHAPALRLQTAATVQASASNDALGGSPMDPRLTFSSFVLGRSNTLAHAAARQVAEGRRGDPVMFNPLYIHSGVGLGKTHLLQAITWAGNGTERRVLYLTAEKFMYGFVQALKTQTALAFKEALRGIDVLVIDDLQFMQGKSSQMEFSHTLNALIDAGKQVVVGADRPPIELETPDDRIRSRLSGGLVVEMGRLGEELRLDILRSRIAAAQVHQPRFDVPHDVLGYLAQVITSNGRDLVGAINRLLAHSTLNDEPCTLQMAEREVRDLIHPAEPKRVRIEDIQRVVARQYNVSRADLLSSRRTAQVVRPRQIAMYLAKTLTLRSLPEIGRRFGGRDHTTVLHAVNKIAWAIGERTDKVPSSISKPRQEIDQALREEVEMLKRELLQ